MKTLFTALLSMLTTLGFGQLNNSDFEVWETTFSVVHYDEIVGLFAIPGATGDFTIYPNPFSHSTTLHTTFNMADASVEVYNVYGQRLRQIAHIEGQTFTLYRDHLSTGQYLIKITQSNGLVRSHKMLIID